MKYFASFSANNNSTFGGDYEYKNKKNAIKDIKSIVRGEHFHQPFNSSKYVVWKENGTIVASGYINDNGWWSINHDDIGKDINAEY